MSILDQFTLVCYWFFESIFFPFFHFIFDPSSQFSLFFYGLFLLVIFGLIFDGIAMIPGLKLKQSSISPILKKVINTRRKNKIDIDKDSVIASQTISVDPFTGKMISSSPIRYTRTRRYNRRNSSEFSDMYFAGSGSVPFIDVSDSSNS